MGIERGCYTCTCVRCRLLGFGWQQSTKQATAYVLECVSNREGEVKKRFSHYTRTTPHSVFGFVFCVLCFGNWYLVIGGVPSFMLFPSNSLSISFSLYI